MTEGAIRAVNPCLTSAVFLGAVDGVLRSHADSKAAPPGQTAAQVVDLLLNGIARA